MFETYAETRNGDYCRYWLEIWDDGGNPIRFIGAAHDLGIANAMFMAALDEHPNAIITMRHRAHVHKSSRDYEKRDGLWTRRIRAGGDELLRLAADPVRDEELSPARAPRRRRRRR